MKTLNEIVILNERVATTQNAKSFKKILEDDFITIYSCDKFHTINNDGAITKSSLFDKKRYRPIYIYIDSYMVKVGNSYGHDIVEYSKSQLPMLKKQYDKVQTSIAYMEEQGII